MYFDQNIELVNQRKWVKKTIEITINVAAIYGAILSIGLINKFRRIKLLF